MVRSELTGAIMKVVRVVGAVLWYEGKLLAAKRKSSSKLGGYWEFPGGKIESNESPKEALERELDEELNISVYIGEEICTVQHKYDFATIELTTFHCTYVSGELILNDHDEVRWLPVAELSSLEWAPADLPTIVYLKELNS